MMILAIICIAGALHANAEFYADKRCSCTCPGLKVVDGMRVGKTILRANIPATQCNCNGMVLPRIGLQINSNKHTFCMDCECKYETRSTTVIMGSSIFANPNNFEYPLPQLEQIENKAIINAMLVKGLKITRLIHYLTNLLVVVIMVCWIVSLLVLYMVCVHFMRRLTNRTVNQIRNLERALVQEQIVLLNGPDYEYD